MLDNFELYHRYLFFVNSSVVISAIHEKFILTIYPIVFGEMLFAQKVYQSRADSISFNNVCGASCLKLVSLGKYD